MEELYDIVDKEDNIIKKGVRENEIHLNDDITRIVTMFIFDKDNKFVIARRSKNKKVCPLFLEAPAHGRVHTNESYSDAIDRETQEELGITDFTKEFVDKFYYSFDSNVGLRQHIKELYIGYTNQDLIYDKEELDELKYFDSFEDFVYYHDNNRHEFADIIQIDINHLKKYFENK